MSGGDTVDPQGADIEVCKTVKITLDIEGMACSMCEAHVNDTIRKNFPVKKVSASHSKARRKLSQRRPSMKRS